MGESRTNKKLRDYYGIPKKFEYLYFYDNGQGQKEYLVKIEPEICDFGRRKDEKIYAKVTLTQVLERTYVKFFTWKPKVISKRVFSDKFLLNKGRNEFDTFKKNIVYSYGLEGQLVEEVLGEPIKKLINFKKNFHKK